VVDCTIHELWWNALDGRAETKRLQKNCAKTCCCLRHTLTIISATDITTHGRASVISLKTFVPNSGMVPLLSAPVYCPVYSATSCATLYKERGEVESREYLYLRPNSLLCPDRLELRYYVLHTYNTCRPYPSPWLSLHSTHISERNAVRPYVAR
jgi:hypothetical protein